MVLSGFETFCQHVRLFYTAGPEGSGSRSVLGVQQEPLGLFVTSWGRQEQPPLAVHPSARAGPPRALVPGACPCTVPSNVLFLRDLNRLFLATGARPGSALSLCFLPGY